MKAVVVVEPGKMEVVDIEEPALGPYQAKVKTHVGTPCNATDGKLIAGHFPGVDRYPLVLGHESAGIIEEIGAKVRNFNVGDKAIGGLVFDFAEKELVSGWGGFCEYTLVNDHDAMVEDGVADEAHKWVEVYEIQRTVPADIPMEEAVLLCTWREVYGGFGDFNFQQGDDILVFGAGPVGLSFVKLGKLFGLGRIEIADPHENKRQRALAMGADAVFDPRSPEFEERIKERAKPLDAVVDAVGLPALINTGLPLIKMGGAVCVYGVLPDPSVSVDVSSARYNFNLYVHQWPTRWRERMAMDPLCEWIRQGKLTAQEFVTHECGIEQIAEAVNLAKSRNDIKILLRY